MTARTHLPWERIWRLHAVRTLVSIINRRWNLGVGFADAGSGTVKPPQTSDAARHRSLCTVLQCREAGSTACRGTAADTLQALRVREGKHQLSERPYPIRCHTGLSELIAPILIDGQLAGALLCGGFVTDEAETTPVEQASRSLLTADDNREATSLPVLGAEDVSFVSELLEEMASEIALYVGEHRQSQPIVMSNGLVQRDEYESIIGASDPMQSLYQLLDRVVASESTVLVQGENGTGKELVAKAIHAKSARSGQRFVVQNCSAFNDNLLDSELFGHKRGAFTGAVSDKQGLFEVADRGTFFLDEIGDMSPALQVKVLRVLQEGTFTPVGDTNVKQVDVRVIAATNRDLRTMVAKGEFREDLYYRINVINLVVPPLRERAGDITQLAHFFIERHRTKSGRPRGGLSTACLEAMLSYPWPGNVRELENEIERLVVLSGDDDIGVDMLSPRIVQKSQPHGAGMPRSGSHSLPDAIHALERRMIHEALKRNNWNKTRTAAELQISRRNLIRLVQKYELEAERQRAQN